MNTDRIAEMFGLDGKTALVTGGSRGIGAMIAAALVDAGATVYISSRNADACVAAAEELAERGRCDGFGGDVSTPEGEGRLLKVNEARERQPRGGRQ